MLASYNTFYPPPPRLRFRPKASSYGGYGAKLYSGLIHRRAVMYTLDEWQEDEAREREEEEAREREEKERAEQERREDKREQKETEGKDDAATVTVKEVKGRDWRGARSNRWMSSEKAGDKNEDEENGTETRWDVPNSSADSSASAPSLSSSLSSSSLSSTCSSLSTYSSPASPDSPCSTHRSPTPEYDSPPSSYAPTPADSPAPAPFASPCVSAGPAFELLAAKEHVDLSKAKSDHDDCDAEVLTDADSRPASKAAAYAALSRSEQVRTASLVSLPSHPSAPSAPSSVPSAPSGVTSPAKPSSTSLPGPAASAPPRPARSPRRPSASSSTRPAPPAPSPTTATTIIAKATAATRATATKLVPVPVYTTPAATLVVPGSHRALRVPIITPPLPAPEDERAMGPGVQSPSGAEDKAMHAAQSEAKSATKPTKSEANATSAPETISTSAPAQQGPAPAVPHGPALAPDAEEADMLQCANGVLRARLTEMNARIALAEARHARARAQAKAQARLERVNTLERRAAAKERARAALVLALGGEMEMDGEARDSLSGSVGMGPGSRRKEITVPSPVSETPETPETPEVPETPGGPESPEITPHAHPEPKTLADEFASARVRFSRFSADMGAYPTYERGHRRTSSHGAGVTSDSTLARASRDASWSEWAELHAYDAHAPPSRPALQLHPQLVPTQRRPSVPLSAVGGSSMRHSISNSISSANPAAPAHSSPLATSAVSASPSAPASGRSMSAEHAAALRKLQGEQ